ncbi:hypothetical protein [Geodermatophilus obscurus]|uniref:hypothetical protein n=1 Tax=Geodermatophilus obscurus TaxID=1861 RepID=UPI00019B8112|nr:hypothetical protein [Geodermatophilus obscurus]
MGEARAPEVLDEHRVHRPRVPHDQAGQQPTCLGPEHVDGGLAQLLPQTPGDPLHPRRVAHRRRGRPRRQPGHQPLVRGGRGDRGPDAHGLARQQPEPLVGGAEEDHGVVQPGARPAVVQPGDRGLGDDARRAHSADRRRVAVQLQVEVDGPSSFGGPGQRRGLAGGLPDRRRGGGDRQGREHT